MTKTNAEILEEKKENLVYAVNNGIIGHGWEQGIKWLIEQAERAQELEKDIGHYREACKSWETVESYGRKENARLRESLENILAEGEFEDINQQLERIIEIACQALEVEKNG